MGLEGGIMILAQCREKSFDFSSTVNAKKEAGFLEETGMYQ
jgi:hypothetical protein